MKLAHFSDIHVTHFPMSEGLELKRIAAVASYTLMGRGRHFAGSDRRIARLLEDVDAQGVDHALCTGDLSGVTGERELARCAELFGPRLTQPERYSLIPGNHDRYVRSAVRAQSFDRRFGALFAPGSFPVVKALPGDVTLVLLDTARPTSVIDSSGLVGAPQRQRLEAIVTDPSLRDRFVVVALHYGLLRKTGLRDRRHHGLRDDLEVMALLDRDEAFVDLVVHGHMHTAYPVRTRRRQVINAGSATDLRARCGYNVYEIDAARFSLRSSRREWSAAQNAYLAAPDSPLNFEVTTRA